MSRWLAPGLALALAGANAAADDDAPASIAADVGDQAIGVEAGLAAGGRVTPGGLRITGHYLYQLSDEDWFDGGASFTFGGGSAACFHDRSNNFICDHGLADGNGVEISATVRRYFEAQGDFRPFARAGVGVGFARFGGDGVSGLIVPLHGGAGVRAAVTPWVAVVAQAELQLGIGVFNKSLGLEPQVGFSVVAGAEFRLE
jgi:hypothetical protein